MPSDFVNGNLFSRTTCLLVTLCAVLSLAVLADIHSGNTARAEVRADTAFISHAHASVSVTEPQDGHPVVIQRIQGDEDQPTGSIPSSTRITDSDIDLASDNSRPRGIWTDGTTIWVVDEDDRRLYAYALSGGQRDRTKELDLVDGNGAPQGLHSDGSTIWVSDRNTNVIFAYEMEDGAPTGDAVPSKNLTLPDLEWGAGLMGDSTTLYAMAYVGEDILAYNIGTSGTFGERIILRDVSHVLVYGRVRGMSALGDKFFTIDGDTVYARIFGTSIHGVRLTPQDFEVPSGVYPWGITAHGGTLWVSDNRSDSLLAFSAPIAPSGTIWNLNFTETSSRNGFAAIYLKNPDSETFNLRARIRKRPNGSWGSTVTVSTSSDLAHTTLGRLDKGELYEMQVSTSSSFSAATTLSVTYRARSNSDLVKRQIANTVVPDHRDEAPWIWEAYREMRRANISVGYLQHSGITGVICTEGGSDSLGWCRPGATKSDYNNAAVTVHELAHIYTINSGVPIRRPEIVAMGWLYMRNLIDGGSDCDASEIYADSMEHRLYPGAQYYFQQCSVTDDRPSSANQQVVRSIYENEIPQWFDDTYGKSGLPYSTSALEGYSDDYDLEKVADDVTKLRRGLERTAVGYQFRNSFGGYCDVGGAWSAFNDSNSAVRNPWRAGGCIPKQVRSLSVTVDTDDDELDVTWDKPAYDGGRDLSNYTVRWRTYAQDFDDSRRMVVTDTDQRSATVPLPGSHWEVEVKAVNSFGAGPAVRQGSTNPPVITAVSAANVAGSPGTVTVTVTTENFDSSIETIYIRHQSTGDTAGPWTTSEHNAAATLTATLTGLPQNTESTIQASLVPTFPSDASPGTTIMTEPGDNSQLESLSVSPKDIYQFSPERHTYHVSFDSSVSQVTVNHSVFQPESSVAPSVSDADTGTDGHQVNLSDGLNALVLTVTSADNSATTNYTVNIGRGVSAAFGWKAQDDLNILDPDIPPYGITYLDSVHRIASPNDGKLSACITRQCYPGFAVSLHADNSAPKFLSNNGEFTVVVTDTDDRHIYAYDILTRDRSPNFEFSLHADNASPEGIWLSDSTAWVADSTDLKIYAYRRSDSEHQPDIAVTLAADNDSPAGIWSDGATIWVVDNTDAKIYAYDLFTSARKDTQDFNTLKAAGNTDPSGLESDGTTIWVTDITNRKAYAYNMPESQNANLSTIETNGSEIAGFSPRVTHYTVLVSTSTDNITVDAGVQHDEASLTITPADADDMTDGHQVDLGLGSNVITFTVTAEDGTTRDYVVNMFKGTFPSAPSNLTGTPRHAEAILTWDKADAGTAVTKYQVRYKQTGEKDWESDWADIPGSDANTVSHTIGGLGNDVAYTIELRAHNPAGEGTSASVSVTPRPRPQAPTNLSATPGSESAMLSWNAPSDSTITHYQYRVSADGGTTWDPDWTDIAASDATTTTHTLTSLTNDQEYLMQLRAVNPYGESDATSASVTPVARPAAPVSLVVSGGEGQVILTWNAPSDSTITHYQYRQSTDDGTTWDPDWTDIAGSGATTTTHTLTLLTNDVTHLFQLRAVNVSGNGTASQGGATPRLLPQAPASLSAQPSDEQVTLSWDNSNNDSITTYQYRHRKTTEADWNPDWTDIAGSDADTVSHVLDDLDNRKEYIFEIRAVNSSGGGTESRVTATPQALPPAPAGFEAQPDDASANLSWADPDDSLIEKYQYRVSADGGTTWNPGWTDIPGSAATTTYFTASGLANAVEHTFEVRAMNEAGEGAASRDTATPNILPPPVGNFRAKSEDTFVTLSWNSPSVASSVTKYQIRYRKTTETEWDPDWTDISGDATTYTASNLTNGAEYTFEIRTVNSRGEGPVSSVTAIPGPPEAPVLLSATIGDKQVSLSWLDPGDDTIISWQYRYREFDSSEWKVNWTEIPDSSALTTSHTVTGLENGADYVFEVRAVNHVGPGAEASVSVISVGSPTIPRQSENITVESQDSALTLYWTRPRQDSRAPITSYILRYREMDAAGWTNVPQSVDAGDISGQIGGLANRQHYEVGVAAVNRVGTGPWATATGTPQGSAKPPPPEGLPEISVGTLGAFWTDEFGSNTIHPDSTGSNTITNLCMGEESFIVIWTGPDDGQANGSAAEWEAHIETWGGAGEVTHVFKEGRDDTDHIGMYGTVDLHGGARMTIKVRGRFEDQGWGEWSPPAGLFCFTQ